MNRLGQTLSRPSKEEIEAEIWRLQEIVTTGNWCEALMQSGPWKWYVSDCWEKRIDQLNDELKEK